MMDADSTIALLTSADGTCQYLQSFESHEILVYFVKKCPKIVFSLYSGNLSALLFFHD
jgi:hypothetical protein